MNPRHPDGLSRRRFLRYSAAFATAAGLLAATGCASGANRAMVRLAAGETGGFYHAFAQQLSRIAAPTGLRIEVIATAGSVDNLALLARGDADTALILADSLDDNPDPPPAIGRVYENYLQLAVAATGTLSTVTELRGARINLGASGSGATHTGEKLLLAAGLTRGEVSISHLPLREAVTALNAGQLDALLWAGGVPTPALAEPSIRLLDLAGLAEPMRDRFGYLYDPVLIPAGTYPNSPAVHTIGVANLLVTSPSLPDDTAAALTELLLTHPDSLVPAEAAGTQFLEARSLIGTGIAPLHPGAAGVYRRNHG
ncbi:TAXI family TRAP transporter solute-binding subunit [Nocardia inohanensis]|uniref:TAXI family TRAP transporter solute-binding subunit n=1 Tax=Nocardia inohanensis TaxID=209246 RepID=UPI00082F1A3E|nr:TAXI family TRAP transporter solute-binding subunit [Nocardia inohanensis]